MAPRTSNLIRVAAAALTLAVAPVALASAASAAPPADGTVGRADDKAPRGQSDGDRNRGYECDDNNGVGNGNPAHSFDCYPDDGGEPQS